MGFFDKVKEKAGEVASDTARASKIAQAQMKVKSLHGDVDKAKGELGAAAYELIDKGELSNPAFDEAIAKIRDAQAKVAEKEAEIAALRAEGEAAKAAGAGAPAETAAPTED